MLTSENEVINYLQETHATNDVITEMDVEIIELPQP